MSEKEKGPEKDYRKVDQPKAPNIFSEPNDLAEALDNLDSYEKFNNHDLAYQNPTGDRAEIEKHELLEDAEKAKKVKKEASENKKDESLKSQTKEKEVKNLLSDEKELKEILESEEAFAKWIGVGKVGDDEVVDTKEFPMDDKPKIASEVGKTTKDFFQNKLRGNR